MAGKVAAKKLIGLIAKAIPPGQIRSAVTTSGRRGTHRLAKPTDLRDAHLTIPAKDLIARGRRYQGTGRRRRNKNSFPETAGPNEVLYRSDPQGKVTYYQVYDKDGLPVKRVDIDPRSKPHNGIDPPHVLEYVLDHAPDGRAFPRELDDDVREALPIEVEGLG